jgi:hypothetical protein
MADNEAANGEAEGAISQPTMLAHFDRRVKRRSAAAGSSGKDKAALQVEDAGNAREAKAAAAEDAHPTVKVEEDAVKGIFFPAYTLMRLCLAEALPEPPNSRFWTRGDRVEPGTVHGEAPPLSPRGTHAQPLLRRHPGRGKGLGRCRGCGHADGSPLSLVPLPHCASILDPLGRTGLLFSRAHFGASNSHSLFLLSPQPPPPPPPLHLHLHPVLLLLLLHVAVLSCYGSLPAAPLERGTVAQYCCGGAPTSLISTQWPHLLVSECFTLLTHDRKCAALVCCRGHAGTRDGEEQSTTRGGCSNPHWGWCKGHQRR